MHRHAVIAVDPVAAVLEDALLFVAAKAWATEEGGGDYISEQRTISDCESAAHIGKTGWEKRRARRDGCSDA